MAERRMFAKTVIDSDSFLDMPMSSQALYFHLSMRADDDGFVNNPKKIQRMVAATDDDLKLLVVKNFLIPFESGVVVIKHWKIHNYIQSDRYKPTVYTEEKAQIEVKENNVYTRCIQNVSNLDTQVRLDKNSIGKNNMKSSNGEKTRFIPPTIEEIRTYCAERNNTIDAELFISHYESNGWKIGKSKMKDWKAAVRTWERRGKNKQDSSSSGTQTYAESSTPYKLASGLYDRIKVIDRTFPKPDIQQWAAEFDEMLKGDRPFEDIAATIDTALANDFWRDKISCPEDLKRSYGKIHIQNAEMIIKRAETIKISDKGELTNG